MNSKKISIAARALVIGMVAALVLLLLTGGAGAEWNIQTIDSAGDVGLYTSIALDSSGYPHISYYSNTDRTLKYAKWTGSAWSIQTVDSSGGYTSIALDSSGNPHISYQSAGDLKYAKWTGTRWDIQIVDSSGSDVGSYNSIALDSSGNPHISYFEHFGHSTVDKLKYARWTGSAWSIQTVDGGYAGKYTSIALDSSGNPHISYLDTAINDMKYAKWNGTRWDIQTVADIKTLPSDEEASVYTSMALDSSGNPHISYYDRTYAYLKYAKWTGSAWNIQNVDRFGGYTSIALDSSGNPHISYYKADDGDLKYAKWNGSAWSILSIDSAGDVGLYSSIALDSSGNAHISYYDNTNKDLKYVSISANAIPTPTIPKWPIVTLTRSLSSSTITEGDSITVTIRVENTGTDAKNVKVKDVIPQNFTLVSGSASQEYAMLKATESRTFQYTMKAVGTGRFVSTRASVTYYDNEGGFSGRASNEATITVQVNTSAQAPQQQTLPKTPGFGAILAGIGIILALRRM